MDGPINADIDVAKKYSNSGKTPSDPIRVRKLSKIASKLQAAAIHMRASSHALSASSSSDSLPPNLANTASTPALLKNKKYDLVTHLAPERTVMDFLDKRKKNRRKRSVNVNFDKDFIAVEDEAVAAAQKQKDEDTKQAEVDQGVKDAYKDFLKTKNRSRADAAPMLLTQKVTGSEVHSMVSVGSVSFKRQTMTMSMFQQKLEKQKWQDNFLSLLDAKRSSIKGVVTDFDKYLRNFESLCDEEAPSLTPKVKKPKRMVDPKELRLPKLRLLARYEGKQRH